MPNPSGRPSARILELVKDMHPEAGGYLLEQWGLPDTLHDPVMFHHEPQRATHQPRLTALTYAANRLAHRYGFGTPHDSEYDPLADHELQELGLTETSLARIDGRAPGLFEVAIRSLN